jgi:asparagine synthase (glutamine-hydrolysing)
MAESVESRLPFLTVDLVEFLLSLPPEYLISASGRTKAVFREAMRGIVPDAILDRSDKISFETPESKWMSELATWARPILRSDAARSCPIVDYSRATTAWERSVSDSRNYRSWIWRWLNLVRWTQLNSVSWAEQLTPESEVSFSVIA